MVSLEAFFNAEICIVVETDIQNYVLFRKQQQKSVLFKQQQSHLPGLIIYFLVQKSVL